MKKKISKIIVVVIALLVVALVSTKIYSLYQTKWKITTITEFENSDNGYKLLFQEVGESSLFGPSSVRIVLENEAGKSVHHIETDISNDGKTLSDENISVEWQETRVIVILDGEEQREESYVIEY